MALVITLAGLALVTVLILTFFSSAQLNRKIALSGSNLVKVDLLARSAMDIVVGEVREELRTGSTVSDGGNPSYPLIYKPRNVDDSLLRKNGVAGEDDLARVLLRKVSSDGAPLNGNAGGRILASSVSTAEKSLNGRIWTASKWYTGSSSPALGSAELPDWVLVTRRNGIAVNPGVETVRDPANANFVIGRFAYAVYDIGGLLDANTAGFPSTRSSGCGYKTTTAYADLTALGLSQGACDSFAAWRNQRANGTLLDAASFQEWATGMDRNLGSASPAATPDAMMLNTVSDGYRTAPFGSNVVLSRRDLLNHPHLKGGGTASYFTHFSRSMSGPVSAAAPLNVTLSNPVLADVRSTAAGTISHYRDDGTMETYSVAAGTPLLRSRFSLARLAWLTPEGPSAELPLSHPQYRAGGTAAAVQACFGLVWRSADARWEYVGSEGGAVKSTIKTLATVAGERREPNFFELLRAGIAEGSLGQKTGAPNPMSGDAGASKPDVQPTLESSKDLQIMKIGANIIDCADTDNYPTILYFEPVAGLGIEVAGIENLPYFHGVDTSALNEAVTATKTLNKLDYMWTPVLFNPHSTASGATTSPPVAVEVSLTKAMMTRIQLLGMTVGSTVDLEIDLSGKRFSIDSTAFRDRPNVARGSGQPQSLATLVPYCTGEGDVLTFRMFSYPADKPGVLPATYTSNPQLRVQLADVHLELRYTTPGGKIKAYASLGSYDDGKGGIAMGTMYQDCNTMAGGAANMNQKVISRASYSTILWDPRTIRLGPSQAWTRSSVSSVPLPDSDSVRNRDPFGWAANAANIHWGKWPEGGKTGGYTSAPVADYLNMRDPDGVTRPADGWLGGPTTNIYRNLADQTRRPVILQRPYRSVAELGYVSRDNPWKTLSFFDNTSADGALLDLFSVSDTAPIVAGRVQPGASPQRVAEALFRGAGQDSAGTAPLAQPAQVANAWHSSALDAAGGALPSMPATAADIPAFLMSLNGNAAMGLDAIKYRREAVARSLAGTSQFRTWNLLIDVVAQTGRYPASATGLADFIVEGEKRYWLSIAIDRYTGKILDRHIEPVTE
ncbi:hypothetical protein DB346_01325 [Verrucomicrobia bacterium LW23]|nr:hypothetical protein DB346_01325 [Verrucomicrobia bacterium LW23]